jgi:hypothetical protein
VSAQVKVDLIIVGGGASGTAAGITAGRLGTSTAIIESSPWLGGMLTSAGVSAIDGNHRLPSGIWGEFRRALENYYGGPAKLATGWVSHTLFEPKIGNQVLQQLVSTVPNLEVFYNTKWKSATYQNGRWEVIVLQNGQEIRLSSTLLIDATELGDIAAAQGLPYRLGMDARSEIGEEFAPEEANSIVQDLTYVATLQDFGSGTDRTIPRPDGYDPAEFACACAHADPTTDDAPTLDCGKMLDYGKLPNGKYMINWPNCGNDHYVNLVELSPEDREAELEKAKQTTLRFVYFIQHELGMKHLGLAEGEYPTADQLPMIPYHRESRRFKGLVDFTLPYVRTPYEAPSPLFRTGIAVGDYTIDHHHKKNPDAPAIDFIKIRVPSYTIPLGALIPENHSGLILAEKSISVSNIVNGATRLQPVVLGIGQAAGILASVAIQNKQALDQVSIRAVQKRLLEQGAYLMPFIDTPSDDPHFQAMQKAGAIGMFKGTGVPYLWANQTWFYPDRLATEYELADGLRPFFHELEGYWGASGDDLTVEGLIKILQLVDSELTFEKLLTLWKNSHLGSVPTLDHQLTRREASVLVLGLLPVFDLEINWRGYPRN